MEDLVGDLVQKSPLKVPSSVSSILMSSILKGKALVSMSILVSILVSIPIPEGVRGGRGDEKEEDPGGNNTMVGSSAYSSICSRVVVHPRTGRTR